ncbi:hypothetical protein ACIQVT_05640 [Streptomyces sp. NPDC100445]|uniref:hypothetical protein n=1 Tax=Streptomyces sp. NPDC100445 TaxID=3366102 RepID=UPI00381009E3
MTADHEGTDGRRDADGAGEYGGMDALMAAITGDPLPEEAHRDPAFHAGLHAAEADVALLRDRLHLLAETLTGERAGEDAGAGGAATGGHGARGAGVRGRSEAVGGRAARRGPGRTGPPGRRRVLRVALGSLAGAGAFCLVLGLGWLAARGGGVSEDGASSGAKSAADSAGEAAGHAGRPADPERELACSRLVVEGAVTEVRRPSGSPAARVTLSVLRSYKPAHGPAEVGVLLDGGTRPAPRTGQHVLVAVGRGGDEASLWAVGDDRVAAARAWITDALPGSRHTPCP